jgi:hypothetical protein
VRPPLHRRRRATGLCVALVASLVAAGLALGPGPALAIHEEACVEKPYTPMGAHDEHIANSAVILAELTQALLEDSKLSAIAALVAAGVTTATKVAALVVKGQNQTADICRIDEHWNLEDQLMQIRIQADLAVTTTADSGFVLPADGEGHAPDFINSKGVGVQSEVGNTIDAMVELKQCTCTSAKSYLAAADSQLAAGNYKKAYTYYRQAYVLAFSN